MSKPRHVRLSTGFEVPLDGDLLAIIEALYKEVTLGNVLNSSISCSNFSLSRNEAAVFRNTGGTGFTATFYLDATQAAQFTAASGNYNTARQVTLGADTVGAPTTPNDDYLTGSVDEFRIETVARSVHWLSAQAAMDAGTFAVYQ